MASVFLLFFCVKHGINNAGGKTMFSMNLFHYAEKKLRAAHKGGVPGSVLPFGYQGLLWLVFGVTPKRPELATGLHPIMVYLNDQRQYLVSFWLSPGFSALVPGAWPGTHPEITIAWPLMLTSDHCYNADADSHVPGYVVAKLAALGQQADVNLLVRNWVGGEDEYALRVGSELSLPKVHDDHVMVSSRVQDRHVYARVNNVADFNMGAIVREDTASLLQLLWAFGPSTTTAYLCPNHFTLLTGNQRIQGMSVAPNASIHVINQHMPGSYIRSSLVPEITPVGIVQVPNFQAVLTNTHTVPIRLPTG